MFDPRGGGSGRRIPGITVGPTGYDNDYVIDEHNLKPKLYGHEKQDDEFLPHGT